MKTDTIGLFIMLCFFGLNFFATQRLYCSKHFYKLIVLILLLSLAYFLHLDGKHPELKFQYICFIIFHYGILLLSIKLGYSRLNMSLVRINWVKSKFENKDFTYVTHSTLEVTFGIRMLQDHPG